MLAIYLDTMA